MFDGWYRDVLCLGGERRWEDGRGGDTEAAEADEVVEEAVVEGKVGGTEKEEEEEKKKKKESEGKKEEQRLKSRFPMQRADPGVGSCRPGDVGHWLYLE